MNKSTAGIVECYLLSPGSLATFAATGILPQGAYMVPIGISDTKEMKITDYDPPKDAYGNILRNKKLFQFQPDSFLTSWANLQTLQYFALITRGCDAIVVCEGFTEYRGRANGVPDAEGDYTWRKNAAEGIYFFDYNAKTHFGIGFEFNLAAKKASIKLDLNVALGMYKATQMQQTATTNILLKTDGVNTVEMPLLQADRQFVLECKAVQYHDGTTWQNVMSWDDIANRSLTIKTVENKREHDNRDNVQLIDVQLDVTSDEANCSRIATLWNINQFAAIRLLEEHPDGSEYIVEIQKNTLTNVSNPTIGKDKRQNIFTVKGQVPAKRWVIDSGTYKRMTIGL